MRRFEPVYARRYVVRPGRDRNGTKTEKARSFQRIGWLCEVCGFHYSDRPGQIPRQSDAERLLLAFALSQGDTLDELKELASDFGLDVQLVATELDVDEDVDHD